MFYTILHFELKYWQNHWSFYLYLFIFFLLAFMSMAGASGAFGVESASGEDMANSPMSIYNFALFFNKLLLFLLPAIVGSTIYKDYQNNFNHILHTYPFSKADYLFGKFVSAFIIVSVIAFSVVIGLILGTKVPSANPTLLHPFDAFPYLQVYFIYLIPNLLLFGIVVFSVVLITSIMDDFRIPQTDGLPGEWLLHSENTDVRPNFALIASQVQVFYNGFENVLFIIEVP